MSNMPIEGNVEKHRGSSVPNNLAPGLRPVKPKLCSAVSLMNITFRNYLMLMW